MRAVIVALLLVASPLTARAEEPTPASDAAPKPDPVGADQPEPRGFADLRYGHVLIHASGGVWVPSGNMVPEGPGMDSLDVGGAAGVRLGVGLGRWLVLFAEAGVGHASGGASCSGCSATSVEGALGLAAYVTQGFAVDPWVSYAVGYRHLFLSLDDAAATAAPPNLVPDDSIPAIDFARVALGFDFHPAPLFGVGPYAATDVGVRDFGDPTVYAAFHAGLRITFDPRRSRERLVLSAKR